METKTQKELDRAKEYFFQLKLAESYSILRRYFDRLPFKPEKEHSEYIGIFVRVLSELGKKNELSFYLHELEKLKDKINCPSITYQLAVVYLNLEPAQIKNSVQLLEKFLKDNPEGDLAAKAKMTLAYCYDSISKDIATARALVFSIKNTEDTSVSNMVETWKAKIYRDEGNFIESEKILNKLFLNLKPEEDWYSFFTAKIISIGLYRDWGKSDLARQLLIETTNLAREKPLKTVKRQLSAIQESFAENQSQSHLTLKNNLKDSWLSYQEVEIQMDESHPVEKLTKLFLIHKKLTKEEIIENLFERAYSPESDDTTIYYHIHGVKKLLKRLGLSRPDLSKKGIYYEFNNDVVIVGDQL